MRLSLLFRITSFTVDLQTATLRATLSSSLTISKTFSFTTNLVCQYQEVTVDGLESEFRVFEIESKEHLLCSKTTEREGTTIDNSKIRVLVTDGLYLHRQPQSVDTFRQRLEGDVEKKWFTTIEVKLGTLLNEPVDVLHLIERRGQRQLQSTKRIFKISIHTIIPQETTIPFQHSQYYNILVRVQFQGDRADEGLYSIRIDGPLTKIQIKGKRVIFHGKQ